ncbi:MAG: hemerythrin domain-containing protein [Labilithrix sp.]|nr:hemerythrin domain-containing protein [Labilithrix sp.]
MGTAQDVVSFLKQQHQEVKALLATVASSNGKARADAFYELRRLLAVHETAEEEIVHPVARRELPDGEAVVEARLREENEAKKALAELEKLEVDSSEFTSKFETLAKDVLAHAEAEEREEFARLGPKIEPARLERMRKAVEVAEAIAPTRPHAGVESRVANLFAGPFASMVDRIRDTVSGKS